MECFVVLCANAATRCMSLARKQVLRFAQDDKSGNDVQDFIRALGYQTALGERELLGLCET
jgi:hypothetical protein